MTICPIVFYPSRGTRPRIRKSASATGSVPANSDETWRTLPSSPPCATTSTQAATATLLTQHGKRWLRCRHGTTPTAATRRWWKDRHSTGRGWSRPKPSPPSTPCEGSLMCSCTTAKCTGCTCGCFHTPATRRSYWEGVHSAREAVERVSSLLQPLGPALAAIDALREEKP